MWCPPPPIGPRRQRRRWNGCCIRSRKRSRSRAGRPCRISCSRKLGRCRRPAWLISTRKPRTCRCCPARRQRRPTSPPPCPRPAVISSRSRKARWRCCCRRHCPGGPRRGWSWRLRRLTLAKARLAGRRPDEQRPMLCTPRRNTRLRPTAPRLARRGARAVSLLPHDIGDAEQHDQRQEEQVHIGFELAVAAQPRDIHHDLLAGARSARAVINRCLEAPRLGLELLDLLEEIECT